MSEPATDRETGPTFETGRYLYCAVVLGDDAGDTDDPDAPLTEDFNETGVDGESVRVLTSENNGHEIAVVVHDCEGLYDTDRMDLLQKWLLEHQGVIDAAGERFGTPLPFQFDTIITGDDDAVREWIDEAAGTLSQYLTSLGSHWEYRIELIADEAGLDDELEGEDARLNDLKADIEEAASGASFLLEKQYDQRLSELKRTRRHERATTLEDRLADLAREVHDLGQQRTELLDDGESEEKSTEAETVNKRTQARFAVLAHEDREDAIGDALDEIASEPGVTIRFTGPWPPYTFAPEIGTGEGQ
jgi:hypothetical protein